MGRKTYTREFKLDAVRLVTEQFYSVSQACKALEIGETAFRRWLSQYEEERSGLTPTAKAITEEQRQIQQLQSRIKQLELEKEILKKATALLMSENSKTCDSPSVKCAVSSEMPH
jgi:transposase